jgi:Fe-S oxidoreductase
MGDKPGGQFDLPRKVIKAVCNHYHEMERDTIRENTFCCGGGGGLLTDDLLDLRIKGASPRMMAMQQVTADHGVTHMAAICAICKTQFSKVMPKYGYEMDNIMSVHQLVANAVILDGQEDEAEPATAEETP